MSNNAGEEWSNELDALLDMRDSEIAGLTARARRAAPESPETRQRRSAELASRMAANEAQEMELVYPDDEEDSLLPLPPGLSPEEQRTMYMSLQRQRDELIYGIDTEDGVFVPPPPLPQRLPVRLADTPSTRHRFPDPNPDAATPFFAFRDSVIGYRNAERRRAADALPPAQDKSNLPVQHLYCGGAVDAPPGWTTPPFASSSRPVFPIFLDATTPEPPSIITSAGCGRLITSRAVFKTVSRIFPSNPCTRHESPQPRQHPSSYSSDYPPLSTVVGNLYKLEMGSRENRVDLSFVDDSAYTDDYCSGSEMRSLKLQEGCLGCRIKHVGCKGW